MPIRIISIVGARPQFIKAATVSRAIRVWNRKQPGVLLEELIVHTGQHYDRNMSAVFFEQLDIPQPAINLDVGSASHGIQTARILEGVERVLQVQKPDMVLTYGDTNSTLAAALAAAKLSIKLAHVEAGLRSFNMKMPEEINRVVTDHVSNILFCPTDVARDNLLAEGIKAGVYTVGDVMYDSVLYYAALAREKSHIIEKLKLIAGTYVLCTVHRVENTDSIDSLNNILNALQRISRDYMVVFPVHPRTMAVLKQIGLPGNNRIIFLEPVDYLDMIRLQQEAAAILTDSGGVQKEAFINRIPCITMRNETEWIETIESGWNILAGSDEEAILGALNSMLQRNDAEMCDFSRVYGDGNASGKIVELIVADIRKDRNGIEGEKSS